MDLTRLIRLLTLTVLQLLTRKYASLSDLSTYTDGDISPGFLIERILHYNAFTCPLSTREQFLSRMHMAINQSDEYFHSCGIWQMASYINHSCISNAHRSYIGDMMIVRASRDLPSGSEVVFEYHRPDADDDYGAHTKRLKQWGFECDCGMCEARMETNESTQRRALRENAVAALQAGKIAEIDAALKEFI
jgi:hypothetical protein